MRWKTYVLLAFLAFLVTDAGGDVLARITIGGETLGAALTELVYYARTSPGGELYMFSPFLAVGAFCGWLATRVRTRSTLSIFGAATAVLVYFYFTNHRAAETAMQEEMWTAAALTIGLLPIFIGLPVVLVTVLVGALVTGFDSRVSVDEIEAQL
jgi:hypothetical protein